MDKSIGHEFLIVLNNIRKLTHMHHPKLKIHMGEFMMLGAIHGCLNENNEKQVETNGVKVGEISKLIHSTKPATSKMLKALEEKGYVERITDSKDRRVVFIRLTQAGETVIKDTIKMMDDFTLRTVHRMGEEDAKELIRLMKIFYQAMYEEIRENSQNNDTQNNDTQNSDTKNNNTQNKE